MKSKESLLETVVHGIFLILGLITVGCVLLITVYLVISGVPGNRKNWSVSVFIWHKMGIDRL